jgi:hypothetical protein
VLSSPSFAPVAMPVCLIHSSEFHMYNIKVFFTLPLYPPRPRVSVALVVLRYCCCCEHHSRLPLAFCLVSPPSVYVCACVCVCVCVHVCIVLYCILQECVCASTDRKTSSAALQLLRSFLSPLFLLCSRFSLCVYACVEPVWTTPCACLFAIVCGTRCRIPVTCRFQVLKLPWVVSASGWCLCL